MTKILMIEDEPIIAEDLSYQLSDLGYTVIAVEHTYTDGLKAIEKQDYDLILLDINLNDTGDGIELASYARKLNKKPLIFLTSYSDANTLKRAKLVEPDAYLIKPIEERELRVNISLALFRHNNDTTPVNPVPIDNSFFIRTNKGLTKIYEHQIIHIESMDNYAQIHTENGRFVISKTLKHVFEQLDQDKFCRIHKKYVINLRHVQAVEDGQVFTTLGPLPIGRSFKKSFIGSIRTLN